MRCIITAAGLGSRLGENTTDRPKCMVEVGGRPILGWQVEALRQAGVERIAVVRGYRAEAICYPDLIYYENPDFRNNNILLSLFCAEAEMEGAFLSSYADILYHPDVVRALLTSPADIALAVDTEWARSYAGRHDHPVEEAELTEVEGDRVLRVGKAVGPERALGEFIGLARYSDRGAALLRQVFGEVRRSFAGRENEPFRTAPAFRKAYLTDLYAELIARGHAVGYVTIRGGWREIDTVEDLRRVRAEVADGFPPLLGS